MNTDRVFVLLLVVLLPLSGCFGDSNAGDAEAEGVSEDANSSASSNNLPPVISTVYTGVMTDVEGIDCTTNAFEIEVRHAMTDWDGVVVNAGWDLNLDGVIDVSVNSSEGYTIIQLPMENMLNRTVTTGTDSTIEYVYVYEYREQSIVFGAQDNDGSWTSSELYTLSKRISYTRTYDSITTEYYYIDAVPCYDFSDVTDYNFSVEDHSDVVSNGDSDYLIKINRSNGNTGIEWDRIHIVFDGDNEGEETCTFNSNRGCRILSENGGNGTESSLLWMPGETITIREYEDDLHRGNSVCEVEIYIDNIRVYVDEHILD